MTRTKAFRQAYWKYHCQPTTRGIKKLAFAQFDERTERLKTKRKEIISRVQTTEKARREAELRRRADRVMKHHSVESDESDESDTESTNLITALTQSRDDKSIGSVSSYSKKLRLSMAVSTATRPKRSDESNINLPPLNDRSCSSKRRTFHENIVNINNSLSIPRDVRTEVSRGKEREDELVNDFTFSFLSEWGKKENRKIRW